LFINDLYTNIETNPTSGSFYIEFAYPHTPNPFYTIFEMIHLFNKDGYNFFKYYSFQDKSTSFMSERWLYMPNNLYTSFPGHLPLLQFRKSVIVFTTNTMTFYSDGAKVGSTQTLSTPVDLSLDRVYTPAAYMLLKSMIYFPHALTDSQAIALTT